MFRRVLLVAFGYLVWATAAQAGLVISTANPSIAFTAGVGGSGSVDLLIASDGSDTISNYTAIFTSGLGSDTGSALQFDSFTVASSSYLFNGNSFNTANSLSLYSQDPLHKESITVNDYTLGDGVMDNVPVPATNSPALLGTLHFSIGSTASDHDSFSLSLDSDPHSFQKDLWTGSAVNVLPVTSNLAPLDITPVPEPGTIVGLTSGGLFLLGGAWWYRRRKQAHGAALPNVSGDSDPQDDFDDLAGRPRSTRRLLRHTEG